jgi:hypothetical protein
MVGIQMARLKYLSEDILTIPIGSMCEHGSIKQKYRCHMVGVQMTHL